MTAALVFALLGQTPAKPPTLTFFQGQFVVRQGDQVERMPLRLSLVTDPTVVMFRRDRKFVVWDDRGLTVRDGKWVFSTRLAEVATTPKLFTKEELTANVPRFASGERKKEATALSGSVRLGSEVYLLLRWDDRAGKPWHEALIRVDFTKPRPKPELLGKFNGFTLARKQIEERLFLVSDQPSAIVATPDAWGLATYNRSTKATDFMPIGEKLLETTPAPESRVMFIEQSAYGTTVVGRANLLNGLREVYAETRGPVRLVDGLTPPMAVVRETGRPVLRNLATGADLPLPADSAVRRGTMGVVVWAPSASPDRATLFDPERWSALATWRK